MVQGARFSGGLAMMMAVVLGAGPAGIESAAQLRDFVAVGVRYGSPPDAQARQRDLQRIRELRFNVVELPQPEGGLSFVDRVLAKAPDPRFPVAAGDAPALIAVAESAPDVTLRAWLALAGGARVILFDDWSTLERNPQALSAAAAFADAVTRNAPLYAPLRPRASAERDVRIAGGEGAVTAALLESPDALLLVASNQSDAVRDVTMTFSPEMPEAVWQNMLSGGSVNFVAGPDGLVYTRTFGPKEVLVLMIRTRLR